jgi:hypothetical protein
MDLFPAKPNRYMVLDWCRATETWQINSRDGDWYTVTPTDSRRTHRIHVRHSPKLVVVNFSASFGMRFSLAEEPRGLFARILMRSHDLGFASWHMDIQKSCEAQPYLFARWPASAMTPRVFDAVCNEMHQELDAFAYELRSKFQYAGGGAGLPAIRPDGRGIQWLGGGA